MEPLIQARFQGGGDQDLAGRLERILIAIGEPACLPLLAYLGTAESAWVEYVLTQIGKPAEKYLQAKIDMEHGDWNVHCAAAIPLLQIESSRSPEIIGHLVNYLKRRDFAGAMGHVANFYRDLIDLGIRGTEYLLIDALNTRGNVPMGEVFLNCGNSMLDQAARAWCRAHGYIVVEGPGTYEGPTWGGW